MRERTTRPIFSQRLDSATQIKKWMILKRVVVAVQRIGSDRVTIVQVKDPAAPRRIFPVNSSVISLLIPCYEFGSEAIYSTV